MKRYYLTEWSQGHLTNLKVDKDDIGSKTNWDDYTCLDLPDNPASDIIACKWRDEVIEAICQASQGYATVHTGKSTHPLNPSDFLYYGKPYEQQQS